MSSPVEVFHWLALRDAYVRSTHEPVQVTIGMNAYGGVVEQPLTVELALAWAERLAEEVLS